MKSNIIWIIACLLGAAAGFLTAHYFGFNYYLWSGLGVIVGSSAGITLNVNRSKEKDHFQEEMEISKQKEAKVSPSKKIKTD